MARHTFLVLLVAGALSAGAGVDVRAAASLLPAGLQFYAGDLHSHTSYSDGVLTPADAFAQARANGLDFMAVTDHSELLSLPPPPGKWSATAQAAVAATVPGTFVAWRGFEQTMDIQGHLNVFGSAGYTERFQTTDADMGKFWAWFTNAGANIVAPDGHATSGIDGLGQFNHPNSDKNYLPGEDSRRWDNFAYVAAADARMVTIEVFNHGGTSHAQWYRVALDAGWHLAPSAVSDTHEADWGDARFGRTLLVASDLSSASLQAALEARHAAATRDAGLRLLLVSGSHLMGDQFAAPANSAVPLSVEVSGASSPVQLIEIVSNGGLVVASGAPDANGQWSTSVAAPGAGQAYYFVKVTEANGTPAYTAPLWISAA